MSHSERYRYDLERASREAIRRKQLQQTTEEYLARYSQALGELAVAGVAAVASGAFQLAKSLLQRAQNQNAKNPDQARQMSQELGHSIYQLQHTMRMHEYQQREQQRQRELERRQREHDERIQREREERLERQLQAQRERELREQEQQRQRELEEQRQRELEKQRQEQLENAQHQRDFAEMMRRNRYTMMPDPVVLDIATAQIRELEERYLKRVANRENLQTLEAAFLSDLQAIHETAKVQAETWREKTNRKIQREVAVETLESQKEILSQMTPPETQADIQPLLDKLNMLQLQLNTSENTPETEGADTSASIDAQSATLSETIQETIQNVQDAVKDIRVEEACRRETLRALAKLVRDLGFFIVGKPQIKGNVVEMRAKRPGGEEGRFLVDMHGGMELHFDHYQGNACKSDLKTVEKKLQEIYGIHLSSERVLWSNPDRLQKDAIREFNAQSRPDSK